MKPILATKDGNEKWSAVDRLMQHLCLLLYSPATIASPFLSSLPPVERFSTVKTCLRCWLFTLEQHNQEPLPPRGKWKPTGVRGRSPFHEMT